MNKKLYLSAFLALFVNLGFSQEFPEHIKAGKVVKVTLTTKNWGVYKIKSIKGKWIHFEDTGENSGKDLGWWNTDQILIIEDKDRF